MYRDDCADRIGVVVTTSKATAYLHRSAQAYANLAGSKTTGLPQPFQYLEGYIFSSDCIFLGVDRLQHRYHLLYATGRYIRPHVAIEIRRPALLLGIR